jgi:hypothetical protein
MEKIRIFCEGISDQRFLRDFISLNYGFEITDNQLKKGEYIHCLNGWTNLKNLKNRITEENSEFTSVIFLDADDEHTNGKEGKEKTVCFVNDLMKSWNWEKYDLFVFPNNKEEFGEVEDFLEQIINMENNDIFECWNGFEECLTKKNKGYNIPAKKSKIYLYHEALHGNTNEEKNKCKDKERNFNNTKLWETDINKNESLMSVKQFLDQYLP